MRMPLAGVPPASMKALDASVVHPRAAFNGFAGICHSNLFPICDFNSGVRGAARLHFMANFASLTRSSAKLRPIEESVDVMSPVRISFASKLSPTQRATEGDERSEGESR